MANESKAYYTDVYSDIGALSAFFPADQEITYSLLGEMTIGCGLPSR